MNKHLLPTAAVLALIAGNAKVSAATVTVNSSTPVAKPTNAAPAGTLGKNLGPVGPYQPNPPNTPGGIGGPITLDVHYDGTLTIKVSDTGEVGDIYQIFFGSSPGSLVSLGDTSSVPLVNTVGEGLPAYPNFSNRTWTEAVTAGTYYLNAADVTMQYIGATAPFGVYVTNTTTPGAYGTTNFAGTVPLNFSPGPTFAPFSLTVTETYSATPGVPEPASLSLLGTGLIAAGLLRRRRAKQ